MREIKFRAWDKEDNTWLYTDVYMHPSGSLYSPYHNDKSADWLIPVLYTGLKDKNGKEIYEGDIVNLTARGKYLCVGHFHFGGWQLYINNALPETAYLRDGTALVNYTQTPWDEGVIEIIGNIYENPELLTVDN